MHDWTDLVEDALLGTDRREHPALLDQAAALTLARRAGLRPGPAPAIPAPAPPDDRPALPPAAVRRLASLLGESGSELLPQWLTTARARGFAAPAALVPGLLDAARQRSDLRSDAVALAGPLGRWLAAANPDWRYVLRLPVGPEADGGSGSAVPVARPSGGDAAPTGADPEDALWREGLFAERVTHLTRLRRRDAAAGLALLRSTWRSERAEDRLLFLDALQEGLSLADEPFLEEALADRARNVRSTAAEMLSALPGSALSARMAARAADAVSLVPDGGSVVVEPPTACDEAMRRDGIPAASPTGRGDRAFWFGEIVAATPLAFWTELLGPPEQALARPVTPAWAAELHEGWARAAVRQHDAGWARALLARREDGGGPQSRLLAVLPQAERAAWTARFLARRGLAEAFQLLVACPAPWPEELAETALKALAEEARRGAYPWSHSGVLGVAERSLPLAAAARVDELAEAASAAWAEVFTRLAGTLRTRSAMLAELGAA